MTDFIDVEPARELRPAFAVWAIAQTPKLSTSSATGFHVPVALYPRIPVALLEGAMVDGYPYDVPRTQPRKTAARKATQPRSGTTASQSVRTPRKRARKVPLE